MGSLLGPVAQDFKAENADLKARLEALEQRIGSYAMAVKAE